MADKKKKNKKSLKIAKKNKDDTETEKDKGEHLLGDGMARDAANAIQRRKKERQELMKNIQ